MEDERQFLMYCPEYDNIRNEFHSLLSTHDVVFKSLNDEDKIKYLLTLENETTSKIVGKYTCYIAGVFPSTARVFIG